MKYIVIIFATTLFFISAALFSNNAEAKSSYADIKDIIPPNVSYHLNAYRQCGLIHFKKIGKNNSRPFPSIETTVSKPCGFHIKRVRAAFGLVKINNRKAQNAIINSFYKYIVSSFRRAYNSSKQYTDLFDRVSAKQGKIIANWRRCLYDFAARSVVSLNEPTTIIVKGANAYCSAHKTRLRSLYKQYLPPRDAAALGDRVIPNLKSTLENKTIAMILRLRLEIKEGQRTPPPPSIKGHTPDA